MYKVYIWTNLANNKKYIGVTKQTSLLKRAGKKGTGYRGCPAFYAAILKYGFDKFEGHILASDLTRSLAAKLLKFYIEKYRTRDRQYGYNLQIGGFSELLFSDVDRSLKISTTLKRQRGTELYRKIMSLRMCKVWNTPSKRKHILLLRRGKYAGRKHISIFCVLLNTLFEDMHKAANLLLIAISTISLALKNNSTAVVRSSKSKKHYTISKVTNFIVDVKESELLEYPLSPCHQSVTAQGIGQSAANQSES